MMTPTRVGDFESSPVFVAVLRVLKWLAWIAVIALAAALPWLVNDWIHPPAPAIDPSPADPPSLSQEDVTGPAVSDAADPLAPIAGPEMSDPPSPSQASGIFQRFWRGITGDETTSAPPNPAARIDSDRSLAAAARVKTELDTALAARGLTLGKPIFIRIFKESSELELWIEPAPAAEYILFKTYKICKWSGELGPKLKEGDGQAPEGFYFVPPRRMNPDSDFHLAFDLGFPNDYDRLHGRSGSYLMVHGDCVSIGCYAMTDAGIDEIYTLAAAALRSGQTHFRVHAFPFRMSDEKMESLDEKAPWLEFWANLKEGYDFFEHLRRPPNVTVAEGKYRFQ
jgi:murein L,D-transpeptidase YafK